MSMAAYGARANLPGFLCLTSTAPLQKKLPLVPFGTRLAAVEGIGDGGAGMVAARLMEEVRRAASRHDLFLAITAHAFNADGMRGIDTIGYELSEQAPDATHVYVPTGGGGLLASIGRGMAGRNLRAKLVACQPSGCAPIARQLSGELDTPAIESCDSRISALQLPQPPDGVLAVEAVRRTSGWGTHVTDESILTAQQRLATAEGVFAEPASATALACLAEDVERGRIGRDDHAVLVVTGAGWKDLSRFESAVRSLAPVPLDGAVEAIDAWALSAVTSRR
jgi:threonine synthase